MVVIDGLEIALDGGRDAFRPSETVCGRVSWVLDTPPEAVELRLFWYTEGRGDRDAGIARTLRIEAPGAHGSQDFELELPSGPYSFSGRLISLVWALELVALPAEGATRREILVGPTGVEVSLERAAP